MCNPTSGVNLRLQMVTWLAKVVVALLSLSPCLSARACPLSCTCELDGSIRKGIWVQCVGAGWKQLPDELEKVKNIIFLNVSGNSLPGIPNSVHPSVTKLDLSYNAIHSLESFGHTNLHNVEELYLDNNHVSCIRSKDLVGRNGESLPFLKKLGLSHNLISNIEDGVFRVGPMLKAVTLSHNRLTGISAGVFEGLIVLEYVDLSHNEIISVEKATFENMPALRYVYLSWNRIAEYPETLPMLEWLDLSHNKIAYIDENQKGDVYPVEFVNLAHNPFICDCRTRWLKEFYDRREYVLKYVNVATLDFVPSCASPANLAGESWDMLGDDVFTCLSDSQKDVTPDIDNTLAEPNLKNVHKPGSDKNSQPGTYESLVNVMTSLRSVSDSTAVIGWILDDPDSLCSKLYIQYYEIGIEDTTKLIAPVSSEANAYKISNLQSRTQYRACVLPAAGKSEVPSDSLSPMQCVQFETQSVSKESERNSNEPSGWRIPDSDEITAYSKLIGFSFLISVLITGALMFFYEIVVFCLNLFSDRNQPKCHKE